MSDLIQATFDYGLLDENTRIFVKIATADIQGRLKRTADDLIAIGEQLIEVQSKLERGQFLQWLKTEFDMSHMTAYRFMSVAQKDKSNPEFNTVLNSKNIGPGRVLYALAEASDDTIAKVASGDLDPTLDNLKAEKEAEKRRADAAKEAEKQAKIAEAKARADAKATQQTLINLTKSSQSEIEELTKQIEDLKKEMEELTTPEVEIREVPKEVIPQSVTNQLETLQKKLASITEQSTKYQQTNKAMQERIEKLNGELQAAIRARVATENDERIRQQWRHITSEAHSCLMRLLGSWPTPLDIRSFDADDWARLDYLKQTLKRVLEECTNLQYDSPAEVPIAYVEAGNHA